jgi:hypothetical protein
MTPRLESATKRLNSALARIERSVEGRGGNGAVAGDGARDVGARDLAAELAAARAENQDLAAANVSVAARLDNAIDRLRAVLRA